MKLNLYDWKTAIGRFAAPWAELVEVRRLNPSLHPAWMQAVVASHGREGDVLVAVLEDAAGVVAVIPMLPARVRLAGLPIRCMDLASNILSYHPEIICAGDTEDVVHTLLACSALPAWDAFRFGVLPSEGVTTHAVATVARADGFQVRAYPGESSPFIRMSGSWPDFLRSLSKKMRANITRSLRLTQIAGTARTEWYGAGSDTDKLLADILEIESKSWKAGEGKAIQSSQREVGYYRRLLPWLSCNGLAANVLHVDERPVAYVLAAEWHGWAGQLKTSFAQDVRDSGFRVIHDSIERAFARSNHEYDFLGDADPHKLRWGSEVRRHESRWVFARHARGRAAGLLKRAIDSFARRRDRTGHVSADGE